MADSTLTRAVRHEIAVEVERLFRLMRPKKLVITFDVHAIQILVFPPSEADFLVPGGPHTTTVRDGYVEE